MLNIITVRRRKELKLFIDFPHDLYKDDPNYVPELFIAQRDLLTKHPFHHHSLLQCFLAYKGGKVAGRIAAILNNNYNDFHSVNEGFFGFFDCVDDLQVAQALFEAASAWLRDKGLDSIAGPFNFSSNETCGLLVEGFNGPPQVMMAYNAPYYSRLMTNLGFQKKMDLFAYRWEGASYDPKPLRLMESLKERLCRHGIKIRTIDMKRFDSEAALLHDVYNGAWEKNMGFVPMTKAEWDYLCRDLKMLLDPDFCVVAEYEGNIVGFALAIPNVNEILIRIKKGRLFPFGIPKLLLGKRRMKGIRILTLGVMEGFRKRGIETCLYGKIIQTYLRKKFQYAEASWTLEHNELVNKAIESVGGEKYRTYRIYEKSLL